MVDDFQGTVARLARFPVKSLRGEDLRETWIGRGGLAGDRAFALRDARDGRILSAKRTAALLGLRAYYPEGVERPARIVLGDGKSVTTTSPYAAAVLSRAIAREVLLSGPDDASPDRRTEFEDDLTFDAPPGAFVDLAPVHLLTTASLRALAALHPAGQIDARRFRPNILVDCGARSDFADDGLVGCLIAIGDTVRLRCFLPTIRCAMTTRAQEDLPADPLVLRTLIERHEGNLGVYATVEREGTVRIGDPVRPIRDE
jgi:hypothetical protein